MFLVVRLDVGFCAVRRLLGVDSAMEPSPVMSEERKKGDETQVAQTCVIALRRR